MRNHAVSIHVPARGTTSGIRRKSRRYMSFNPRSRTGNDAQICCVKINLGFSFNPRSRTGNDRKFSDLVICKTVSIHVPARGTTSTDTMTEKGYFWFQSTFPHGERLLLIPIKVLSGMFQSTFPHGERRKKYPRKWRKTQRFNPRSRTGNDG